MAPRKKDKAKVAARKQKRAGKDVLRDIYDMCPEANSGEAGVTQNGKEFKVLSRKLILLPESIGTLEGLEALNLSCSQLLELPHTIGGLKALTMLDLSECASLTKLPGAIGELKALTELDLSKCSSLAALPDAIGELGALTELNLSGCSSLAALPAAIGELKALTELNLRECSSLVALPDAIGGLGALKRLDLRWCLRLAALPATISWLGALTSLDLSECLSLEKLPEGIIEREGLKLKLPVPLTPLGEDFAALRKLRDDDASGALKEFLGDDADPRKWRDGNAVTVEYSRDRVTKLTLFQCSSLAALPAAIGELKALTTLDLSYCSSLVALPESIAGLDALKELWLNDGPKLTFPPQHMHRDLDRIKRLLANTTRFFAGEVSVHVLGRERQLGAALQIEPPPLQRVEAGDRLR